MSLTDVVERLSVEDKKEFIDWYNGLIAAFELEFGDGKTETNRDSAILLFRESFIWWYKKKPKLPKVGEGLISKLDILKTRVCLLQIGALTKKLQATDIEIGELNLREYL